MTATTTTPRIDEIRGRFQAQLFAGIPDHIRRLGWSATKIVEHQRDRLGRLLSYAAEHSPFHARRLARRDPTTVDPADLSALPVMTKADLMGAFDDVLTDRRVTRTLVERALAATTTSPVPLFGNYVCMTSGGSSGQRCVHVADVEALVTVVSSVLRPMMARMAAAGGPPPSGVTIGLVAAASAVHATGAPPALMAGSPINFVSVPATLPLSEIVERLNALQPDIVFGYASMLARLARMQRAGRLAIAPTGVTSTSEMLLSPDRDAITDTFGAPLIDTFGSTEGLYGITAPDDTVFVFNSDVCIVELVDEHNQPVPPGTPSAKILVTNLVNRTQPLIRYEINDRFVRRPDAADHGHLRATLEGRSDEIFSYGGGVDIHPLVVRTVMVTTPAIQDYRVRQTEHGIDVTVLADGRCDTDQICARLRNALTGAGLSDPEVAVTTTSTLPRHDQTGKLQRFLPST
jgi:phenylacetate-CoA ligase